MIRQKALNCGAATALCAHLALVLLSPFSSSAALLPGELIWEAKTGFRDAGGMIESSGLVVTGNITGNGGGFEKFPLHVMNAAGGRILWTHRVNRPIQYKSDWETHHTLATISGVYYENTGLLAKAAR